MPHPTAPASPPDKLTSVILGVLDKVLWTRHASDSNKLHLMRALRDQIARTTPQVPAKACDAARVLAVLDTGEWALERIHPDEARPGRQWIVKRTVSPFCAEYEPTDPRYAKNGGPWGPRLWMAGTALVALERAAADLGIPLVSVAAQQEEPHDA